jgi:hypothetical protein
MMTTVAAVALTLMLGGAAFAAENDASEVARLRVARDRVANGAQSVKPAQAARLRQEADELQRLIDQAESGRRLDPEQVDQAIRRSYRNY